MTLIQTVSPGDLYHMASRMDRCRNFGYKGWRTIGDYLEGISKDMGENIEIDIIAICCDFSMAESVEDAFMQFNHLHGSVLPDEEDWEEMGEDEKLETIEEFLRNKTSIVACENDLIIWQAF